jgi:hypothetical protein
MPLHWTIDSKARLFTMVAEGPVEMAELHRMLDVAAALKLESNRKLFDGSRGESHMTDAEKLAIGVRFREMHANAPRLGALAVVVRDERYPLVARMLGILAVPKRPIRVFTDLAKARAWLDSPAIVASAED